MEEGWLFDRGIEVLYVGFLLAMARPLSLVLVIPIFTRFGLQQGLVRGGIIVAFAAPVFPGLTEDLMATGVPAVGIVGIYLLKELLIGLILGLALGVPLWAVSAAGDYIDMQRGASMATMVDPGSGDDTTPTGTLLFLLAAFILVMSGYFTEVILSALYATYATWPVLEMLPPLDPKAAEGALVILAALARTGLVLALPLLGTMLLTEFALALAGRYTPQINVMFLALSVKQILYILILPIYLAALSYFVEGEIRAVGDAAEQLRGFLDPDLPEESAE